MHSSLPLSSYPSLKDLATVSEYIFLYLYIIARIHFRDEKYFLKTVQACSDKR
jgi:hypothetical protein